MGAMVRLLNTKRGCATVPIAGLICALTMAKSVWVGILPNPTNNIFSARAFELSPKFVSPQTTQTGFVANVYTQAGFLF